MDIPATQARYQLRLFDTNGVLQAIFDDWRTLELQRRIDTYDTIQLGIDGSDSRIPLFGLDCIIEVWRKLADTPAQYITTQAPIGYARTVINDKPTAYWRLDEPIGQTQASDLVGGNTGTYTGGVTLGQTGALATEPNGTSDPAVLLDGINGRITTVYSPFVAGSARTFEVWVNPTDRATFYTVLGSDGGGHQVVLRMQANGDVMFWSDITVAQSTWAAAASGAGVWFHLVLTYDDTTKIVELFVNGASKGTRTSTNNYSTAGTFGAPGNIEWGAWGAALQSWKGRVDEAAVYPTALSAARVLAHYNAGLNQRNSDTASSTVYVPGVSYQWYREGVCMHRTATREITQMSTRIYTSYGRGLIDLLRRREIMYFANTAFTLKGGASETIMKQYVDENAGPGASNAARLADGTTQGLTVEASAGRGLVWAGQRSWQNLLDVLQEISTFGGVDFDVVRTDTGGPIALEFRCYYPQLGADRTATVLFAPNFDNMLNPFYTVSRTDEVTRVAALGPGEDTARRVIVRDGSTINDSPWNKIEKSQDARQDDTLTSLQAAGDAVIATSGPQKTFTFEVLQTSSLQYGRDYFLGDKVTAAFDTVSETKKITGVTMNVSQGRETVQLTFSDVPQTT